jgi:hypothetical protein
MAFFQLAPKVIKGKQGLTPEDAKSISGKVAK